MSLVRPFSGLRPAKDQADALVAPPYDVLNTEEARARAEGKPWSFLHISKPEIDLPPDTNPYDASVYAKGAENLARMIEQGVLIRDQKPCYYVYRLNMKGHIQVGLVAAASVADYDTNRIRKHEFTRPAKEDDRVRQIEALNAQTGPVFLVYPSTTLVDDILLKITEGKPEYDVKADDGVQHSVWVLRDVVLMDRLTSAFDAMPNLYVADGHHRSAAASRIAASRKASNPNHTGDESYNYFLTVIFPHHQMKILDYNRVVRDLNGLSEEEFLQKVEESFEVRKAASSVKPNEPGLFGLYLKNKWFELRLKAGLAPEDPVGKLDVSLLAKYLIDPVLGISNPRTDERIDFIGGIRGLSELEKRVNSGEMKVAFSLHPTGMEELMAVADVGEVMPPKSTWFEPKLADGLLSHVLD